jgi:hypothetical protein
VGRGRSLGQPASWVNVCASRYRNRKKDGRARGGVGAMVPAVIPQLRTREIARVRSRGASKSIDEFPQESRPGWQWGFTSQLFTTASGFQAVRGRDGTVRVDAFSTTACNAGQSTPWATLTHLAEWRKKHTQAQAQKTRITVRVSWVRPDRLGRLGTGTWCRQSDSNRRPTAYKAVALPTELCRREPALSQARSNAAT